MKASPKYLLGRAALALFISLFFLTPICTLFVPFCTSTWIIAVVVMALLVFLITERWVKLVPHGREERCREAAWR